MTNIHDNEQRFNATFPARQIRRTASAPVAGVNAGDNALDRFDGEATRTIRPRNPAQGLARPRNPGSPQPFANRKTEEEITLASTVEVSRGLSHYNLRVDRGAGRADVVELPTELQPYFKTGSGEIAREIHVLGLAHNCFSKWPDGKVRAFLNFLHNAEKVSFQIAIPNLQSKHLESSPAVLLLMMRGNDYGEATRLRVLAPRGAVKRADALVEGFESELTSETLKAVVAIQEGMLRKAEDKRAVDSLPPELQQLGKEVGNVVNTAVRNILSKERAFLMGEGNVAENAAKEISKFLKNSHTWGRKDDDSLVVKHVDGLFKAALHGVNYQNHEEAAVGYGLIFSGLLEYAGKLKEEDDIAHMWHHALVQGGLGAIGFAPPPFAGITGIAQPLQQWFSDKWHLKHKKERSKEIGKYIGAVKVSMLKYGRPDFCTPGHESRFPNITPEQTRLFFDWFESIIALAGHR